jgi:hypothetical protein
MVGWRQEDSMIEAYRDAFMNAVGMDGVPFGCEQLVAKRNI